MAADRRVPFPRGDILAHGALLQKKVVLPVKDEDMDNAVKQCAIAVDCGPRRNAHHLAVFVYDFELFLFVHD
jgi:hypothetical protein